MDFNKLGQLNQTKLDQANQVKDKTEQELSTLKTQEVFVKSIQLLTKFMEGHTTRTVVVNQIRDFATSGDIDKATKVLDELHATLKTHENTDVSPVVDVLNKVVSQLEKIPKEHPELPEVEEKDYTEQFNKFIAVAESIVEAVNAQETNVEAPTVNVDAPVVNVEAPDLKPLASELDKALRVSFKKAIDGIKPAKPTDLKPIVKAQEKTTKAIDRLYKLMEEMPSGGGGGGGAGIGSLSESTIYESRNDTTTDTNLVYLGKALPGSATSDAAWQIKRYNKSAGTMTFADDVTTFTKIWDNRTGYTY